MPTDNSQFSLSNLQTLFQQQKIIGGPDLSTLLGKLGISYPQNALAGEATGSELSNIGGGPLAQPDLSTISSGGANQKLLDLLTNASNWQTIQQYNQGAGQQPGTYFQYTGPTQADNQGPQAGALPQTIAPTWLPTKSQLYGMQPQAPGTAIAPPTGNIAYNQSTLGAPTAPSIMGPLDVVNQPPPAPQQPAQPGQPAGSLLLPAANAGQPPSGANWQGNLASNFFGLRVPRFQEGGLITEPTLAMVGESGPEAIVPVGDKYGYDFLSNPTQGLSPNTALFAPVPEINKPGTATATPQESDIYRTQAPNYLQTSRETGSMQQFTRSLYTPDDSIRAPQTPRAPRQYADQAPITDPTAPDNKDYGYGATKNYLRHGEEFANSADRVVGNATTFGLNYDGSIDPMDSGKESAFGYKTADRDLEGASLPVSVIKNSIGDYTNNPEIMDAIKRGDYKVAVTSADGRVTKVVPLRDAGPADWTGNAIDLTYRTSHDLNTNGKAKVGYRLIGPDGDTLPVRGYHPQSSVNVNWDDHIGPNQEQTDTAVKEALHRNQWASTEPGVPAGYKPPEIQPVDFTKEPAVVGKSAMLAATGKPPEAFIMHHTGGGTLQSTIDTLKERHLGVEYIMDRDGSVHVAGEPGAANILPGWGKYGKGLTNQNIVGMEVVAKDNNDVTPAQVKAAQEFIRENYPNTPVFGHGEVNPGHKEADEGLKISNAIRAERAGQSPAEEKQVATQKPEEKQPEEPADVAVAAPATTPTATESQRDLSALQARATSRRRSAELLGEAQKFEQAAQARNQPGTSKRTKAVLSTLKEKPVVRTPEEMPAFT